MELLEQREKRKGINVYKAESIEQILGHYKLDNTTQAYNSFFDDISGSSDGEVEYKGDIIDCTKTTAWKDTRD